MQYLEQTIGNLSKTSGLGNPGLTVTIHETGNRSAGAGARAHANLQSRGNVRTASWHWSVDDQLAIQSFRHNVRCWHAGTSAGNNTSVAIEICVNPDSDFVQACKNAAQLTARILREKGRGVEAIRDHNDWSGKNCPTNLLSGKHGVNWSQFLGWVQAALNNEQDAPVTPPSTPATNEETEMKLWHTVTPWGERIFGYATAEAGAGTIDVNTYQHEVAFWGPGVELTFPVSRTIISEAWRRQGLDADAIAEKVVAALGVSVDDALEDDTAPGS